MATVRVAGNQRSITASAIRGSVVSDAGNPNKNRKSAIINTSKNKYRTSAMLNNAAYGSTRKMNGTDWGSRNGLSLMATCILSLPPMLAAPSTCPRAWRLTAP